MGLRWWRLGLVVRMGIVREYVALPPLYVHRRGPGVEGRDVESCGMQCGGMR